MKNRSVGQTIHFDAKRAEALFNNELALLQFFYGEGLASIFRSFWQSLLFYWTGRSGRRVVRHQLTDSATTGSKTGHRSMLCAHAAIGALVIGLLFSNTIEASAATKTTRSKAKTTAKRKPPVRVTTTVKRSTTTIRATSTTIATSTSVPKLSAEAQAVLAGYESYLVVLASAAHDPEHAQEILPKGVTGDALARLIDIARFNVAEAQYWDGKRADILSKPRIQSIGESRATLRDCQTVGGVLRKRATNFVVPGSTDPDIDDLIVDLVKIDGRWVVTRTDRTNAVEGKGTCAPASSP